MPIMMNIGNLLYVLVAVVGGALALSGVVGNSITIGVIEMCIRDRCKTAKDRVFRTETGKQYLEEMFLKPAYQAK